MSSKNLNCILHRALLLLLVASAAAFVAACGGGNQSPAADTASTDASASATPVSQTVLAGPTATLVQPAMSGTAAGDIAASALMLSEFIFNTAPTATLTIPGVSAPGAVPDAVGLGEILSTFAWGDLSLSSSRIQGIVQMCPSGGSLSSAASTVGSGNLLDTVSMVARDCGLNGFTINGALTATVVSQTRSATQNWSVTSSYHFTGFTAASATATATFDGDLTQDLVFTPSGARSFQTSGTAMHVVGQRIGQAPIDVVIRQYKTSTSFAPGEISSAIEFTQQSVDSSGKPNTIVVKTPQTFIRNAGLYASSGVLSVSDGVSSATVTALDGTSARVDYSPAGDGVVTESTTLTWSQFLSPK
jgi:hypothetical protein